MGAFDYSILRMFWFSAAQSGARHTKDPRLCTHAAAQQSTRAQRACRDKTKETARAAQPRTRNQIKRAPALAAAPGKAKARRPRGPFAACILFIVYLYFVACQENVRPPPRRRTASEKAAAGGGRLSKKSKSVAVGGHAPTTATHTGKFCGKLCARNAVTSARFAVKFCRRGFQRAAELSAACGGYSEAKQGQRSQSASAIYGAPRDAGTATRRNRRVRRSRARLLPPLQRVEFLDTLKAAAGGGPAAANRALLFRGLRALRQKRGGDGGNAGFAPNAAARTGGAGQAADAAHGGGAALQAGL